MKKTPILILLVALVGGPVFAQKGGDWAEAGGSLAATRHRLERNFDTMLKDPARYAKGVEKQCGVFPEGKIYPYALPALAYANLSFADPSKKEHARQQIVKLIDLAIPSVTREVKPPGGDLLNLRNYQKHATYLGTLNLVLGSFQLATGDGRYARLHEHLTKVLEAALREKRGAPIESYPEYSWNFDTIMALASLDVYDRIHGTDRAGSPAIQHMMWIEEYGTDRKTGLPYSTGWKGGKESPSPPRGCDLSMRICLLAQFFPERAKDIYRYYVSAHWLDLGFIAGFSEWPKGTTGVQDVDSGPVLMGIGSTASSMGLGAAIAMGDKKRELQLTQQMAFAQSIIHLAAAGLSEKSSHQSTAQWFDSFGVRPRKAFVTGFLYGDAALFYAVTWVKYPGQKADEWSIETDDSWRTGHPKLDNVRIPLIEFGESMHLEDVVAFLEEASARGSPDGVGLKFELSEDLKGRTFQGRPPGTPRMMGGRSLSLGEVLRIVCEKADMEYEVRGDVVYLREKAE